MLVGTTTHFYQITDLMSFNMKNFDAIIVFKFLSIRIIESKSLSTNGKFGCKVMLESFWSRQIALYVCISS